MLLADIAIAALGGAAVGFERQRSGKTVGPDASFGGLRTFTLLGAAAGVAGAFAIRGWMTLAAILIVAAAAIVVISYGVRSRGDIDATTEVAALVVLAAGTLAGAGETLVASALIALTTVVLVEKERLHALTRRLDEAALTASARFAVLALVVLPLLPSGAYGPFGSIRPRELWLFVLFFSGLSFAAWITRRWLGATAGTVATGVLGGLISSTSVTLVLAQASRSHAGDRGVVAGSIAASTVMLLRVTTAALVLNLPLALAFLPYGAPMAAIGAVAFLVILRPWAPRPAGAVDSTSDSPLQLAAALKMTASFGIILIVIEAVTRWAGPQLLLLTSAAVGITDLDALTLSLARRGSTIDPAQGARALTAGVIANTLTKMSIAAVVGRGSYRVIVPVVLGTMAAIGGALLLR